MTKLTLLNRWMGGLAAFLLGVAAAIPMQAAVHDNAGFFSESARTQADRNISELEKRFKKDLVIETFKDVPEEFKKGVDLQDKEAATRMFDKWAVSLARQRKVNGVYVLLSKEPSHLHVVVGNDTQAKAFTLRDRDALVSLMLGKLRSKDNDQALLEGVKFVSTTMASHVAGAATTAPNTSAPAPVSHSGGRSSFPWGMVIAGVIGLVVVMMIIGFIRAMMSGGKAGGVGAPGMGGGGFMSSLLGGMFGAAAGMWLYNQFSGHNSIDSGSDLSRRNEEGFSGQDSDYSGSGGDFGDSGGGDSGGGGGDF